MDLLTLICRNNPNQFPSNYVLPPNERPQGMIANQWVEMPVIDLNQPTNILAGQVMRASQDFGMFQIINHGVSSWIMDSAMTSSSQFFDLPAELLYQYATAPVPRFPVYTGSIRNYWRLEKDHLYWRDALTITYNNTTLQCMNGWPSQPPYFRDTIFNIGTRLKIIETDLLKLVSQGLGLERTYFTNGLADWNTFAINRYPRCPFPGLTCGLPKHCDPNLLTIQVPVNVPGLQILINDDWYNVAPRQNALIVTMGRQMEVISNGILKAAEHRVIANNARDRTSLSYFAHPDKEFIVGPAPRLITISNPCRYRSYPYREYLQRHLHSPRNTDVVVSHYRLN